ncbi:hypothetical protein [Candidatus Liberibacter americanus]|uniref:Uncharacterized protein n=1 Tax=Candidatus Liberibacter americanus str. Sao Paulo TaxID=1261131 RepID=U6B4V9_9HYPH|nr:hypothetical protein [Candidatus Liberibacter americanus]AHA28104.1 hypothetical protein lam_761 [Candidatus Liberibacter americanus str. Sao Paulo]EMS36049.1 hypothetical protein G653_03611 [Candidatus Liberibacter americanus PW_SP]
MNIIDEKYNTKCAILNCPLEEKIKILEIGKQHREKLTKALPNKIKIEKEYHNLRSLYDPKKAKGYYYPLRNFQFLKII